MTGIDTTCKPDSDTEYGQYNLKVAGHGRWRIRQGTMACRAIKYKLEFDLVREVERAIHPREASVGMPHTHLERD